MDGTGNLPALRGRMVRRGRRVVEMHSRPVASAMPPQRRVLDACHGQEGVDAFAGWWGDVVGGLESRHLAHSGRRAGESRSVVPSQTPTHIRVEDQRPDALVPLVEPGLGVGYGTYGEEAIDPVEQVTGYLGIARLTRITVRVVVGAMVSMVCPTVEVAGHELPVGRWLVCPDSEGRTQRHEQQEWDDNLCSLALLSHRPSAAAF